MNKIKRLEIILKEKINLIKKEIEKKIDGNKKTIAFVSYNQSYRNQVGNLHRKFKEAGFNVINIVGFKINDRFEKEADTFVIPKVIYVDNKIIYPEVNFEFIDLIISPDKEFITEGIYNENFLSKKAKKIYLPHDAIGGYPLDFFDYTLLPSQEAIKRYKNCNFRKKHCLIPGGYPKLDYSIEKYNNFKKNISFEEDSIIYAPTKRAIVEKFDPIAGVCAVGFDSAIIEILNKNFDEKIIFRPHPHNLIYNNLSLSHYSSLILKKKFENSKKIVFNYSQDYLEYYKKSKCMVTDTSDTVFNYSFTTLKPALFIDPFEVMPYTFEIGKRVKNISEMKRALKNILQNLSNFKEKILNFRNLMVNNIGKTGEYLIENIDYILSGKKHPDWYYF